MSDKKTLPLLVKHEEIELVQHPDDAHLPAADVYQDVKKLLTYKTLPN